MMLGWNGGGCFMDGNDSCAIVADIVQKVLMLLLLWCLILLVCDNVKICDIIVFFFDICR